MLAAVGAMNPIGCSDEPAEQIASEPSATCLPEESQVEVLSTDGGINFVRTPESHFASLPDYEFNSQFVSVDDLHMAYVDAGPSDGEVILLLHGEPSWSYLYRYLITRLSASGYRVIAPDLVGMGRSDKPVEVDIHTYEQHVAWMRSFVEQLDLQDATMMVHDWGGLIGLRVVGEMPSRFARVVATNTRLPIIPKGNNPFVQPSSTAVDCSLGEFQPSDFQTWLEYALKAPNLRASEILQAGTAVDLPPDVLAAYDAPYPSYIYKAAIRAFPSMITAVEDQNQAAWDALGTFDGAFLTLFGELDPNLGTEEAQNELVEHIPGAAGQYHERFPAHHFLQEDLGRGLAGTVEFFLISNPLGVPACWQPDIENGMDCEVACARVLECNPGQPSGICVQSCLVVAPYLTVDAASLVQPCLVGVPCDGVETFQNALDGCMAPAIFSGDLPTPAEHTAICDQLAARSAECDPDSAFGQVCTGLAAVFTTESMEGIGACGSVPCDQMGSCLLASNCTFRYDDRGAVPD